MEKEQVIECIKKQLDYTISGLYSNLTGVVGLGSCENVSHYGGEGMGDIYYDIYYFHEYDLYVKVSGFYTSYDGVDYYDFESSISIVRPKEQTVTVYE